MKSYILTLAIFMFSFIGIGQTIKPLETEWTVHYSEQNDSYFKDINNVLDKFVGTWKYENAQTNTVFEITFTKVLQAEGHKNGFVDELSAQFKLTVNGIEKYDTSTTNCNDCFIPLRFSSYQEEFENDTFIYTQPNVNIFVASIAEPLFEDSVLSSNLKLEYQYSLGSPAQLIWTNKVDIGRDYNTNEIVNNYQMPLNMVLIKQ